MFTEGLTQTAATETLLFTETTTITESQTNFVGETITIVVTSTDVQQADVTVTTTATNYQGGATLKARQTASPVPLPAYASAVCAGWDQYVNACQCAGYETTTVTAPAVVETVTVTAGEALTTTVGTLDVTLTETVFVTATALVTEIDTVPVTQVATSTTTITVSSTTTVSTTSTPTTVVPLTCKPVGVNFLASNPFPDGSTRWMNTVNSATTAWQTFPANHPSGSNLATSQWVLDSNGYLQLATSSTNLVAYMSKTATTATVKVQVKPKVDVDADVAAGIAVRIKTCINAATNVVTMSANGRSNMLSCGSGLYLSTGNGSDVRPDCVQLAPVAE